MGSVRAAVYMRVSSDKQRENETIGTQRDYAQFYQALHPEIELVEWYADDGVSASKPIHISELPEGARLLRDAKAGHFQMVLLYKLDRLGRNARLILNGVGELEAAGQRVVSMKDILPVDTGSPAGRLMLAVLAGVAGFERDTFVERALDGSNRLAREGAWLGGSAPYGYKVEGRGRHSRLVINDDLIPGSPFSEADVVRIIFRLCVEEGLSCPQITTRLHALGIPPAYGAPGRQYQPTKNMKTLAGIWRYGRIRAILVSTTYKGIHQYGKNASRPNVKPRIIERPAPALVSEVVWEQAQGILKSHFLYNPRGAKRQYLLRGLIKCGECGYTYIGKHRGEKTYYLCNGRHNGRWIRPNGERCQSKAITEQIETSVWSDIESFLRSPGAALDELKNELEGANPVQSATVEVSALERSLAAKKHERDTVVMLFRRGRIDEEALEKQLNQVEQEEMLLQVTLAEMKKSTDAEARTLTIATHTNALLEELRARLDNELSWEEKRGLVELLVHGATAQTDRTQDKPVVKVSIDYAFPPSPS